MLRKKCRREGQLKGGRDCFCELAFALYTYMACRQCVCNVFVYPEDRRNCTRHVGGERSVEGRGKGGGVRSCIPPHLHTYVIPGHEPAEWHTPQREAANRENMSVPIMSLRPLHNFPKLDG